MNDISRYNLTIGTGRVNNINTPSPAKPATVAPENSFAKILDEQQAKVTFSKHAQSRLSERNIVLSENNLEQLNNAVRQADEKGLRDTLVLMDKVAFIVNVPSNKVITTLNGDDIKGNVFTNIDGAVII